MLLLLLPDVVVVKIPPILSLHFTVLMVLAASSSYQFADDIVELIPRIMPPADGSILCGMSEPGAAQFSLKKGNIRKAEAGRLHGSCH